MPPAPAVRTNRKWVTGAGGAPSRGAAAEVTAGLTCRQRGRRRRGARTAGVRGARGLPGFEEAAALSARPAGPGPAQVIPGGEGGRLGLLGSGVLPGLPGPPPPESCWATERRHASSGGAGSTSVKWVRAPRGTAQARRLGCSPGRGRGRGSETEVPPSASPPRGPSRPLPPHLGRPRPSITGSGLTLGWATL